MNWQNISMDQLATINQFLPIKDCLIFSSISKQNYNVTNDLWKLFLERDFNLTNLEEYSENNDILKSLYISSYHKLKELTQLFPKELLTIIGSEIMLRIPKLDLQNRVGQTGYIDFLVPNDLPSDCCYGVDLFNRPFLAFLIYPDMPEMRVSEPQVNTIFQRDTDDPSFWVEGSTNHLVFANNVVIIDRNTIPTVITINLLKSTCNYYLKHETRSRLKLIPN